jgi:hypothetical protein
VACRYLKTPGNSNFILIIFVTVEAKGLKQKKATETEANFLIIIQIFKDNGKIKFHQQFRTELPENCHTGKPSAPKSKC